VVFHFFKTRLGRVFISLKTILRKLEVYRLGSIYNKLKKIAEIFSPIA
jgi:hypothetical protein